MNRFCKNKKKKYGYEIMKRNHYEVREDISENKKKIIQ